MVVLSVFLVVDLVRLCAESWSVASPEEKTSVIVRSLSSAETAINIYLRLDWFAELHCCSLLELLNTQWVDDPKGLIILSKLPTI